MSTEIIGRLKKLLAEGKDWKTLRISTIPGAAVTKIPKSRNRPARLSLAVNPIDPETEKPIKRKAVYVLSPKEWGLFLELFQNQKADDLLQIIEDINQGKDQGEKEEEYLEF